MKKYESYEKIDWEKGEKKKEEVKEIINEM